MNNEQYLEGFHLDEEDYVLEYYLPGESVIRQGDPADYLRIIVSGTVNMPVQSSNGKSFLNMYALNNCMFGVMELLTNDTVYMKSAVAVTKVKVAALTFPRARILLRKNNIFCLRVAEELACQLDRSSREILSARTRSAEERLCFYLLEHAEGDLYKATITSTADATGVTYRHTMRLMKKLCEDNLLIKEGKCYRIIDRENLIRRAQKSG